MGESTNQPNEATQSDRQAMQKVLRDVTQDLRHLQQDLVSQMSQDVSRLQAERSRLLNDVEKLRAQQEMLQSEREVLLNQQQLAQQKVWAKQLAQALAGHLQQALMQRLQESGTADPLNPLQSNATSSQAMLALDATLNQALASLQQDLTSYHHSLTQQMDRMQTLEKQGEVLLEALVSRLSDRLQAEVAQLPANSQPFPTGSYPVANPSNGVTVPPPPPPRPVTNGKTPSSAPLNGTLNQGRNGRNGTAAPRTLPQPGKPPSSAQAPQPPTSRQKHRPPSPAKPLPQALKPPASKAALAQQGLIFILLSTLALSLHNVVVRIIGGQSSIFGIFNLPGSISLNSLNDSLLILWLRMVVVVPVMMAISGFLYPAAWQDVKTFTLSRDWRLVRNVLGSGVFLFLSQVLIYIAIGGIGPGVAVTILFMYPLITVPLAWWLFGDRPTLVRWAVMVAILCGVLLTAFPRLTSSNISPMGVLAAILSGVFFALYLISMQISFRKLHPVPVSLVQFFTIFVLTSIMLGFFFPVQEPPSSLGGLMIGGLVLGSLTLFGYLLNNLGVQRMGAARASIVASSGPVLTALLAFVITGDQLQTVQWAGIALVTLGILGLSFERMALQRRTAKATQ